MRVRLAYGKSGLDLVLKDSWDVTVLEPLWPPAIADPDRRLVESMRSPIGAPPLVELLHPGDEVGIVISDVTRPVPNRLLANAIIDQIKGFPLGGTTVFVGLGTHRRNTIAELREMVGEVADVLPLVQNDAFDRTSHVAMGKTSQGNELWINRRLAECDVKVLTGCIEPHFFAGFSGGGKAVLPGMAGIESILGNHSARMIAHPRATWGITIGNPIWEETREAARKMGTTWILNVSLDKYKAITGIFCGDLDIAHATGCEFVKRCSMVPVQQPFEIVITTNSGFPLDLNLYQSVKGMSAAAQVVRPGGAIVIATECRDGIPDHGMYGHMLREAGDPRSLLDRILQPGFAVQDQWTAQIQAQVLLKASVYVKSEYLSDRQIEDALLRPAHSLEETVSELVGRFGTKARICVIPEGPMTIPFLEG